MLNRQSEDDDDDDDDEEDEDDLHRTCGAWITLSLSPSLSLSSLFLTSMNDCAAV